jgi:hypothetical protein
MAISWRNPTCQIRGQDGCRWLEGQWSQCSGSCEAGTRRSSGGVNHKKLGFNNQFNMENMKNIGFSPSILL